MMSRFLRVGPLVAALLAGCGGAMAESGSYAGGSYSSPGYYDAQPSYDPYQSVQNPYSVTTGTTTGGTGSSWGGVPQEPPPREFEFTDEELRGTYVDAEDTEEIALETTGGDGGLFAGLGRRRDRNDDRERSEQTRPAPDTDVAQSTAEPPTGTPVEGEEVQPQPDEEEDEGPLLVYTGRLNLAVYEVEEMQLSALSIVENAGGWSSERGPYRMVFRVPAEEFRTVLDALAELGDVLSVEWWAEEVTDQFRDTQIRLRNALEMRTRLEALLAQAETVEAALAVEQQLERITLEIERLRGQLNLLADRVAYSTIEVNFSAVQVSEVPGDEYRLPFSWLNELGLPNLLYLY